MAQKVGTREGPISGAQGDHGKPLPPVTAAGLGLRLTAEAVVSRPLPGVTPGSR